MAEEILTKKDIQELLVEQTTVILDAVDERIKALDLKFTDKFDKLTTTLDNFLKRMTDIEDEFTMMRNDINRIKKTIKEKLGVELS
jgi:archaellum component FlaC